MSFNNNGDNRDGRRINQIPTHPLFLNMASVPYPYIHNVHLYQQQYLHQNEPTHQNYPLDLRRSNSVETRLTISPYNISSNDETSPTRNVPPNYNNNITSTIPYRQFTPITNIVPEIEPVSPIPENDYRLPPTLQNNQLKISSSDIDDENISSPLPTLNGSQMINGLAVKRYNAFQLSQFAMQRKLNSTSSSTSPTSTESSSATAVAAAAVASIPLLVDRDGKLPRPFKIYPKNPLNLIASFGDNDSMIDRKSEKDYIAYRSQMIKKIYKENGGFPTKTNPKMRRISTKTSTISDSDEQQKINNSNNDLNDLDKKDAAYYERRKKNNAAAKKSRDRRRLKEDDLAIRTAFLEGENYRLRVQLEASIRREHLMQQEVQQLEMELETLNNNLNNNNQLSPQ